MGRAVVSALLVLVVGGATVEAVTERAAFGAATPWVAPYHPCYQWSEVPADQVPWGSVTHLILGYMVLQELSASEYTIAPPDWYGDQSWRDDAGSYVAAGSAAGRTVTCMLGGEGSNPGEIWNHATAPENVALFAANITAELQGLGFAGVDLDWEDDVDSAGLVRLAQALRAAWPQAVITIPTSFVGDDATGLAPAAGAVDAFMPMTYIAIPQWGGWTLPSPLTPLHVVDANKNSIDWVRQRWAAAGVDAAQLVMGIGGFGLVWGDTNGDGLAPIAPYSNGGGGAAAGETAGIVSDNAVTQAWLAETLLEHPGELTEVWDPNGKISYWHSAAEDVQVTADDLYCVLANDCAATAEVSLIFYETPHSISAKVTYVAQHGMRGMMFWTLSQMRDGSSFPNLEEAAGTVFADGFETGDLTAWSSSTP